MSWRFAYQDVDFGDPAFNNGASATVGYQQDTSTAVTFSVDTPALANGDVLDLVNTASMDDVEQYSFDASAGIPVDVVIDGISRSFTSELIELLDPSGAVVATASTSLAGATISNADQAIAGYVPSTSGEHSIRITSSQTASYAVLVTEDLVYDLEPNGVPSAMARPLDNVNGALGVLNGGTLSHSQYNDPSGFVDISATGASLTLGDDGEATVSTTVGNDIFPAGSVTIGNNGGIIAAAGEELGYSNTALPSSDWATALLPLWDDIDDSAGSVYWQELLVDGMNTLIVQWHDRPHFNDVGAATFQVQVFESGPVPVRFAYQDIIFGDSNDNGGGATIGVQLDTTNAYTISQDTATVFDGDVIDFAAQEDDVYSLALAGGETVVLETTTPLDDPNNVPNNTLDTNLRIVDAGGNTLMADANSAADGKNAKLTFTAATAGTYYVAVSAEGGSGTYVLTASGATAIDGDFDDNGVYDCFDIDLLTAEVSSLANNPSFDLTGDGLVDLSDRDAWLAEAATFNGFSDAYLLGDLNLDGTTDGVDFIVWNSNKFTTANAYCSGDINMDGFVDGQDFIEWNSNKFQSIGIARPTSDAPATVGWHDFDVSSSQRTANVPTLPQRIDAAFASFSAGRRESIEKTEFSDEVFTDVFDAL